METITYEQIINLVKSGKLYFHHSSTTIGYIRKKDGIRICEYKGRFGTGYTVEWPNVDGFVKNGIRCKSNNLHRIGYFIEK